jgi:DNA-binding NarL/FixJ family response regulator
MIGARAAARRARLAVKAPPGLVAVTFGRRRSAAVVLSFPAPETQPLEALPRAQREVAALLVEGLTLAAIARRRRRSRFTIMNQVQALYRRLGVGSRPDLVRLVTRR